MTTVEVLRAARERISDPEMWWDGAVGRGGDGRKCADLALGEICRNWDVRDAARRVLTRAIGEEMDELYVIYRFNDTHTHAEVLAAFDTAIANEEAREAEFTVSDPLPPSVVNVAEVPA